MTVTLWVIKLLINGMKNVKNNVKLIMLKLITSRSLEIKRRMLF